MLIKLKKIKTLRNQRYTKELTKLTQKKTYLNIFILLCGAHPEKPKLLAVSFF